MARGGQAKEAPNESYDETRDEARRESEARLRFALDAAGIGEWELELSTQKARRSLVHDRIFGYDTAAAEWSYDTFLHGHVHPDDRDFVDRAFQHTLSTNEDWDFECRIFRTDGAMRLIWARGRIYQAADGTPLRLLGLVQDITERRQAELRDRFLVELDAALQRLEDPDRITATAARLLGENLSADRCAYAEVEADGTHVVIGGDYVRGDMAHIEGRFELDAFGDAAVQLLRDGRPYIVHDTRADARLTAADLDVYDETDIRALIAVPLHKSGRFAAGMAVHQRTPRQWTAAEIDLAAAVTNRCWEAIERARVTRDLRRSEERLRRALDIETVGVAFFDSRGAITAANDAFLRMTGYGRDVLADGRMRWDELTPPEWIPSTRRALAEFAASGRTTPYEKEFLRKDGSRWWGLCAATRLGDDEGVEYILDISERKEAEEENRLLNAQLERRVAERTVQLVDMNRELEAFSYSVSHDLRTPLRGIDGFSQALLEDCGDRLDDTGRRYLGRIRAAARRMGNLIDDLLDLSRLSRSEMHTAEIDLSALAGEVVEGLRERPRERPVAFRIAEGVSARGDGTLLRIVLDNLLENAWKYTQQVDDARVEFGVERRGGEDTFFVRDNGIGFDQKYAHRIFEAFQRLHASDGFEGTGIGLATVQRIVHRHNGKVWVDAEPERGATFYFTLSLGD